MHLPTVAEPCNRILFCAYLFFIRFSSRSLVSSAKRSSCHRITFNLTAILVTITILLTTQLALYNAFLLPPAYSPADAVAFPSPTTTTYFEEYSTESTDNGPLVTSPPSFSDLYPNLASLKSLLSHRLEQATSGNHNEDTIDSTDLSNANDFSPKDVAAGEQRSPGARSSSPNADGRSPANDHNGWMSEDLLPKEKSIINIKLVKRVRPHINVATDRDARTYLSDPQLDFESSFAEHHAYGCRIRVRRAISRSSNTNEFVAQSYSQLLHKPLGPLQAEITVDLHHNAAAFKVSSVAATAQSSSLTENGKSAYLKTHPFNATSPSSLSSSSSSHFNRSQIVDGPDETTPCSQLPLHILKPYAHNLTQLVVFNTNVRRLRRFEFGSARLDKLQRLDIIHNRRLLEFEQRSFDGLARLEYLAVINNARLQHIPATAFAGAKQLQELLLIGNGNHWSSDYLHMLLRSATASILPNLVHLHVRGVPLPSFTPDQWARADAWRMLRRFEKLYGLEAISSYRPLVLPSQYEHIWHPFDPSDWVDSEEDRMNVTADTDELRRGFGCGSNCNHRRLSGQIEAQQHMPDSNGIKLGRDAFAQLYQIRYLQLEYADLMHLHSEVLLPLIGNLSSLNLAGNTKLTGENLRNMLSTHNTAIKNHNSKASAAERIDVLRDLPNVSKRVTVTGLSVLDLSDTIQSERIPRDLLATIGKSTIQYVRFGDVSWRQLRNGDIPPMPSLRTFEIRNSLLQEIEPETLSPLTNLENLNLQGNLLSTIPLNMLEPLPQLQRLDLSGYDSGAGKEPGLVPLFVRFRLQRKTFVYGTNLRSLRLDHKRMVRLQRSALIGLFKLEDLSMRYCDLRHVEYLTFFSLKSIVRLDLSGNPALIRLLRSDQEDTFVGLEALQQLTMNDCELEDEDLNSSDGSAADTNPAGWLKRVYEQLKVLHLAGNRLTELTQETLASFEQLRELDLSRNRLISWHNRTLFSRNAFVQRLDVSGNRLHSITPEMLADFRKMRWLSFARNPLHCECGWQAPLLLWNEPVTAKNSGHQPPATLNQAQHAVIQQHLKRLVDRQQQIVSAVFSSAPNQAPPNSVLDWLRTTNLIFERGGHPLQSSAYYCVTEDQNEQKNVPPKSIHSTIDLIRLPSTNTSSSNGTFEKVQTDAEIEQQLLTLIRCRHLGRWANCDDSLDHFESMGQFFEIGNCSASGRRNAYHVGFSFALIGALAFSIMLLSAFCLLVAFVYHASLRSLISKVEQDLLHSYDYDAFVSYSVNDSEWVFNQLVPGLEEWPTQFNQPMLDAPNSMLAGPSPNAATGPTASSDTIPNTWYKRLCKVGFIKNQVWLQSKNMFGGKNSLGESKATATANVTDNESDSTCSIDMKTCRSSRSNSTSSGSSYMSTASQLESADGGPVDPNQCAGQSKATPGEWNANIDPTELKQIRLCVYDRDFIAGRPIAECIAESIRSSRKVILVISNNFIASPWCRFETDLAHNTMLDQNRDGLILIRLEEKLDTTMLEKVAPQLHFLLKTRIYLQWSADPRQQEIFWRKLYSALGFPRPGHLSAYNRMRHYYQHYWPIATQTSGTSGQSSGTNCASSAVSNKLSKTDIKRRHSVVLAPTKGNMGMPLILHHHSSQTDENNNRVKGRLASISCNGKLQNSPDPKFEGTGKGEAAARSMSGPVSLQLTADKPDSEPENNQKPVYETLSSCGDNSLNCNLQPLVLQQLFQESKFRVNEIDRTQRKMDTSSTITGDRVSRSGPSNTSNEIQLIPLNRSQTYFGQSIYEHLLTSPGLLMPEFYRRISSIKTLVVNLLFGMTLRN